MTSQLLLTSVTVALGAGALLAFGPRARARDLPERAIVAFLPLLGVLMVSLSLDFILTSPASPWNDLRLAPAAALARGYGLYYLPGEGPMLGHIYGPVAPLVYLPAVIFPTPSAAIRAGVILSLFLYLIPVTLMLWNHAGGRPAVAAGCAALFALFAIRSPVVNELAFRVHVDAPAIAFAALACIPLMDPRRRTQAPWLVTSAISIVLAVGSKQVVLPVVFALPTYLWLADGRRAMLRYISLLGVFGLIAASIIFVTTDVPAMLYQTLVVPSEHPWRYDDGVFVFGQTLRDLAPRAFVFVLIIAAYGFLRFKGEGESRSVRRWVAENPWLVPVFVGLFCLPTSILGRMKVGGSMTALAYTNYFFFLGALLAILHAANENRRFGRFAASRICAVLVLVSLGVVVAWSAPRLDRLPAIVADLSRNSEASGYAFVRDHPGQVYLPHNPLITLMAEDRAYHLLLPMLTGQYMAYAAADADLAATDADDMAFRAHLPDDLRYVLDRVSGWTPMTRRRMQSGSEVYVRRYLSGFRYMIPIAPGWQALVTEGDVDPSGVPLAVTQQKAHTP